MTRLLKQTIASLLWILPVASFGQHTIPSQFAGMEPANDFSAAIERAREQIDLLLAEGAPGVSAAVGVDGQIVWAEAYGLANVELGVPVSTKTRFRVGSTAKTMTTLAMAQLLERGILDLDEPIQTYLPHFPAKEKGTITVRLLASHRAGVRHYLPDGSDNFVTKHYNDVLAALEIFQDDPLIAVPGERYSYSSHGYNLLSAVMQEASGVEYLTLMRETVFAPLRMIDTVADHTDYVILNRASPYSARPDGMIRPAPYVDNSYKWAGGGFLSTPTDLIRLGYGVFGDGLISAETRELLTSPPLLPDGSIADQDYGLGWQFFEGGWLGHTGGSVGGNTVFMMHPDNKVAFAMSCNLTGCLGRDREVYNIGRYFAEELSN